MKQTVTPDQLARKFAKAARAVKDQDKVAIEARALVTKQIIVSTAESTSNLGRKFGRRFVKYNIGGTDTAFVRLWSGFGHLAELGSYKASASGWDEEPKNGGQALATQYGFFPRVDHPPIAAHPFWGAGVTAARKPGQEAWAKSVRSTITKALH